MEIQTNYLNLVTSVNEVSPSLTAIEFKTEAVRKRVMELKETLKTNEKTIVDLKNQLAVVGLRPNGFLGKHFGVIVSMEPGELGKLETEMFALRKSVHYQQYFIDSMKKQLGK